MKKYMVLILIFIIALTAGCGVKPADRIKITAVLDWTPNTNHTGLYVALSEGFFEKEGLEVTIIQPQEGTAEQIVASGSAQFGIGYQESVTFARAEGIPIVSLAAVIQHNTSGFASLAEKGITSPKDFENRKYGGWGSPIEEATLRYLMEQEGADPDKLQIVTTGDADFFQMSATGEVDYAWIFEGWTGIEAKLRGIELNYIELGKVAEVFDYYTPVIITSEKMINENRDVYRNLCGRLRRDTGSALRNLKKPPKFLKNVPELDRERLLRVRNTLPGNTGRCSIKCRSMKWERYMLWLFRTGSLRTGGCGKAIPMNFEQIV